MRFARVHKAAAYVLAVLGLVALCAGGELGGTPTVLLALGVVLSWFAEGQLLESQRYVRTWNVVVLSTLVVEVLRATFLGLPTLTAAIEFAALLQLSRLANRRTARDYQQITVLAMLHLIAATVLGGGLSYAACFVGFVIATPWAMTLGHLRREIEGNYLADARAGRQGVPIDVARILRSRRVVGPGLLIGSSLLAVPVFAMTAVVFVFFPRIGLGIFSIRPNHASHVTGLSDDVDLRGHGTIRDDPTIVLRVEPPDLGNHPPAFRAFRLRGASFDVYDGHAWHRTPARGEPLQAEDSIFPMRGYPVPGTYAAYRIVLDALDPPVVLVPDGTIALRIEPRIEGGVRRYPTVTHEPSSGEVRYGSSDDLGLVYTAYVGPAERVLPLSPEERFRYLQLPRDLTPRIVSLAHQLTDARHDATSKALAVQDYLRRFRYTLQLESGSAAQPLDDFLFRTRAGHCEFFSTAMAIMLRSVGIPARNVTGFLGGTYNRWGHFYAIRQGDAHSWVEAYVPGEGWITFDPTPLARETPIPETGVLAELDALVEAMRVRWRRYVVSYDLGTQVRIAMRLMHYFERRQQRAIDPNVLAHPPSRATVAWRWVQRHRIQVATTLLLGAVMVGYFVTRRRSGGRGTVRAERSAHARDAIQLAQALDAALTARGYRRPRSRSPIGFADDLERAGAPMADLARRVAERYAAARFGDQPLRPGEFDSLRRELRQAPNPAA